MSIAKSVQSFFMKKSIQTVLVIVAVGVILYLVSKMMMKEGMTNILADFVPEVQNDMETVEPDFVTEENFVKPSLDSMQGAPVQNMSSPGGEIHPEELLPKSADADAFDQQYPKGEGDISSKNFVVAGYNIGINTQGSSLRNANYQIRSEPANPITQVSPWGQATITPDFNRKTLEIGQ